MTAEPRDEIDDDFENWRVSPEAADFIETAKILAEPYNEKIAALTARLAVADRENAELRGEVERLRELVRANAHAVLTFERERNEARAQLAAAQAQLADARVEVGRTRALCDRYPGARPGGATLPNLPEVRDATGRSPMTRPDATLDQLHLVIDWAQDQGLHDAEQWLRERVAAAEERMGVRR